MSERFYKLENKKKGGFGGFFSKAVNIEITLQESDLIITQEDVTNSFVINESEITINDQPIKDVNDVVAPIKVKINSKNQECLIHGDDFEEHHLFEFLNILQNLYYEYTETFEEKLRKVNLKCQKSLKEDRILEEELIQNMGEIYQSVYQIYTLGKNSTLRDLQTNPNVSFYYLTKHNYYVYFLRSHYKTGVTKDTIMISENLINTVLQNLNIVRSRKESYQNIQEHLIQVRKEYKQKKELEKVAKNLASLQERNMKGAEGTSSLGFDTEVLTQIENLTETISLVQTEEQSLILKEHIALFEKHSFTHYEIEKIKTLNKRLTN